MVFHLGAEAQFVSYNDHAPGTIGVTTSSNATTWNILGNAPGSAGVLKDIRSATPLPVTVTITRAGTVTAGSAAANPASGTPLYSLFNGYVDFRGAGNSDAAVHVTGNATVTYTFSGLDTNRTYSFAGSAVRGGTAGDYSLRWSLFELTGAASFRPAHTGGAFTNGLSPAQVAINTGVNTDGEMAVWDAVVPGTNGSFAVVSSQYTGPIPGGITATGSTAYALTGFRLVEYNPPRVVSVSSVGNNALQIVFSIPVDPASVVNLSNYSLTNASGAVPLFAAALVNDSKTVQLTTGTQAPYGAHWLSVGGVQDAATGLSEIDPNTQVVFTNVPFTAGYIKRETYLSISNTTIASLTNNAKYPDHPDQIAYLTTAGWQNLADNYGARISGLLTPPLTGLYYFAIRSDDTSQLWLSPNNSPAAKSLLTAETACCQSFDVHTNGPIFLTAGQGYYFEALLKAGTGSDYLFAAWKTPTNMSWNVIPGQSVGNYLSVPGASVSIQRQPTNTTAMAGDTATFSVAATGSSSITTSVSYQWQLNGFDIAGATASAYSTPSLTDRDDNSVFRVLVSVPGAARFSSNAVLTVFPDTVAPRVVRAFNVGLTNVQLVFSEPIETATATNLSNYIFSPAVGLASAVLDASGTVVGIVTATPLVYGTPYSIKLNGIRDRAGQPNNIVPNTTIDFIAAPFAAQDVGNSPVASALTFASNGLNLIASGADIGGFSDQCTFAYQLRAGDFDVQLRVATLELSDLWAKGGLMARETLDQGSRFAAALATPGMNGCFFESRDPTYSPAITSGMFPANYPNTWVRLRRTGNVFTGYAGYDGHTWTQLGSVTIAMSAQIYLGPALSSRSSSRTASAQFRDVIDVSNAVVAVIANPNEPIGPSSRKSPIAISEIMYKPAPRADGLNLAFIELYNSNPWFQDISGYQVVAGQMAFTFPPGTVMPGGGFIVLAAAPADVQAVYGIQNVFGPYTGSLKKSGTIRLLDEAGAVRLTVPYSNLPPWPIAADGSGHSLVLSRPSYGEQDPRAWSISDIVGGSPGAMECFRPDPLRNVVINEFLAHTDPPDYDYIELYNHGPQAVDLSGCILTDDLATNKFAIPPGTLLPPGGYFFCSETNMGFALSAAGESIYFKDSAGSRVLDAVAFGGQENGVACGRWPDGADQFYRLQAKTPGAPNAAILSSEVVINELMYHPISGNDDDQYIELYNGGNSVVDLAGWTLSDAVSFTFPSNTVLAPDSYLVVSRNPSRLLTNYPNLSPLNTLGSFSGKLSGSGERLALTKPDTIVSTNSSGRLQTNLIAMTVDEITYATGGRWGKWSDRGGSSLERIDPHSNGRLAANWADSDETHKSLWTTIQATGVLDNGKNYDPSIGFAQLGLLDAGECLVDNVEVIGAASPTNLVVNPDFETGLNTWTNQGCHIRSGLENEGFESSRSLHVRASSHVWTGDNSCELALYTNTMAAGQTATLRFKARWLCGWPEALLRLNGNWLEAAGRLPVPSNLGTPGAPNSRLVGNAGPAIYEVSHYPAVPATNQSVLVTARVHDPDGVTSLTLNYRVDPATSITAVTMRDDGLGGDAIAGDGIFSATIPSPNTNKLIAFYLTASDSQGATTRFPALRTDNAPVPECVVRFGDANPSGSFGVYHLWLTQTNANLWSAQSDLSNEAWDCTFAYYNRVIYNVQARFAGSPYHQGFNTPYGNLCHYKWVFPDDDKFLGATSFNKIHQPGNGAGDDASIQREQTAHTFLRALGVPWLNRRYVAVYVNGNRRGTLMEDAQCPDADVVEEYWPDDTEGWLYKMQPWFEFAPAPRGSSTPFANQSWCTLMRYTTTGGAKKVARYRYNYLVRRTPASENDFTNVFSLVDAASSLNNAAYAANMQNLADMENWMRVFAANHAAGNWDSFGAQNAQNLYGYLGTRGTRYSLLMWDFNIVLGNSGSWGPGQNLFTVNNADANMSRIYNEPTFRRMYWRALQELVNGPLLLANTAPLLDAKFAAFTANGLSVEDPNTSIKSWISQAHDSIASQIAAVNTAAFNISNVTVNNNVATISGTAPFAISTLSFNGVPWPVRWNSITFWTATVPLASGTNTISIVGTDRQGAIVGSSTTTAVASAPPASPAGQIVINEIMYNPALPNAGFIELYNNSTANTFDLSGWTVKGLGYTFPPGSLIGPRSFVLLAQNRAAFAAAYGATVQVFDTFPGNLQGDGETLTLLQPLPDGSDLAVTKVRYGNGGAWPDLTTRRGTSLQLIDSGEDNWRPGNWAASSTSTACTPGAQNNVLASLPPFPPLWVNEIEPENLTGITNSAGQRTAWFELYNGSSNLISLAGLFLSPGYSNLLAWSFPPDAAIDPGQFKVIYLDGQTNLSSATELHTDFIAAPAAGSLALVRTWNNSPQILDNIDYTGLTANRSFGSFPDGQSFDRQEFFSVTPGGTNDPGRPGLSVAINEWMAANTHTLTNPATGKYSDWFELYNYGTNPADLAGFYLTDSLTNKFNYRIPSGYVIPAGGFLLVWADGSSTNGAPDLHASFKMSKAGESLGLYSPEGMLVDFVIYGPQTNDISEGRFPDGAALVAFMPGPTPRTNNVVPNSRPVLQHIPDFSLILGQSLSFTAAATDSDRPAQQITFALGNGGPAGVQINPVTGQLAWTPTAIGTNSITVVATDNGAPRLSATETFAVTVFPPPQLATTTIAGTNLCFSWFAVDGQSYQIDFKDRIEAPFWSAIGLPITGTGSVLSVTNVIDGAQGFYRIRVTAP